MDLIQRCLAGDGEAFADLFHRYKDLVIKTAFLLLGSTEEAEDALQEVFLKVHRSLGSYDPSRGAFSTWLYRITVNHCLKQRRKRRPVIVSLEKILPFARQSRPSFEEQTADRDMIGRVLDRLTENQRTVVILRYYLDLSYAEIAQVLDIPVGTVRSRLNQATKNLRRDIERDEQAPQARQATPTGGG